MQTPEEFAREWLGCHVEIVEPGLGAAGTRFCGEHRYPWLHDVDLCPRQERAADLIRERDAEVRADERAKVLAGFTEERADRMVARRVPCDCPGDWQHHARLVGDDGPEMHATFEVVPSRRLVGPWEPTP